MYNLYYKFKKFTFENIPGDVQIILESYITDSTGLPFMNSSTANAIDFFNVETLKSSLPISSYEVYFQTLAEGFISDHYSQSLSGDTTAGSNVVTNVSSTANLFLGQSVVGSGIPVDTVIQSIRSSTSFRMSTPASATATEVALSIGTAGWTIDYSSLNYLVSVVNFANL